MSADVKANTKQQEVQDLLVYLTKKYLQNSKYNKKRCIFHSILVGTPFILILLFLLAFTSADIFH